METTVMSRRIQIATLKSARISTEIRHALRDGLDPERVADFLADIDWRDVDMAPQMVKQRLGLMEGWATQFAEGDISDSEYATLLSSLLPQPDTRPSLASRTA